jgi:hypothetical protein
VDERPNGDRTAPGSGSSSTKSRYTSSPRPHQLSRSSSTPRTSAISSHDRPAARAALVYSSTSESAIPRTADAARIPARGSSKVERVRIW